MGRPNTIPLKAWNIWHELFGAKGPDVIIATATWNEVAIKHGIPASRQGQAPYLEWLEDQGYILRVHGGFRLSWGDMMNSSTTTDGLFVTRPDGVNVQVLSAKRVRELGLWSDDSPNEEWEPVFGFRFPMRGIPGWGEYLRRKAGFLREQVAVPAVLKPFAGPPNPDLIAIEYLENVHWYFLNDLDYKVGDLVDLETWRLILAHDFESAVFDENAQEYHGTDAASVFTEATHLAARLGLIKIEPDGIRLRKAPRKTVNQPQLKSSAQFLVG